MLDMQCIRDCDPLDPKKGEHFEQPVVQTIQMFIGEMGCWLVVACHVLYRRYILKESQTISNSGYQPIDATDEIEDLDAGDPVPRRRLSSQEAAPPAMKALFPNHDDRRPLTGWKVLMLALPACCDIAGTTLMNVGLLFVAASIYQMTRGALVLFVGLFSVMFLKRKLQAYQWLALLLVVIGVGIVGLAGAIFKDSKAAPDASVADPSKSHADLAVMFIRAAREQASATARSPAAVRTIIGVFLIAGAQIFTATQFVLEEWILENYALEPLKVVGWEGVFGFLVTLLGMFVLHLSIGRTERGRNGYFDAVEGWREMSQYRSIAVSSVLIMISIGGFNFFGLSVTRTVSATSRSTIDTCRTLFIWIVSLGLGWETFKWLQVVGFILLVYGTFLFNNIVRPPLKACLPKGGELAEGLLPEEPIEHL
ncbi:hypothetical protein FGG08_005486 [Glutinoglossum americanum]|uniref:Integral membrane protein n=1 Tax=Glutinoglossum americanum TaxID=1670608 RepID=A0A9P8I5E1_9PEZI|nr:hypothetical protein FGG08_005486 [Glutinoglossum americanum]